MYASDINQQLWQLGFELFRDEGRMCATFFQGDILDPESDLKQLSGEIDIIIASQLLHLFGWEQQKTAMKSILRLSRVGTTLVGYQRGQLQHQTVMRPWGELFLHDLTSFREIWVELECETGSRWELEAEMVDLRDWGMEDEDLEWMPPGEMGINFAATRHA